MVPGPEKAIPSPGTTPCGGVTCPARFSVRVDAARTVPRRRRGRCRQSNGDADGRASFAGGSSRMLRFLCSRSRAQPSGRPVGRVMDAIPTGLDHRVHGRCACRKDCRWAPCRLTPRWSGPLARLRSPRPLNVSVRRTADQSTATAPLGRIGHDETAALSSEYAECDRPLPNASGTRRGTAGGSPA